MTAKVLVSQLYFYPPLPFIVIYRVLERADAVEIVNVIHGAQRWPQGN
jgi:plasmid stabilization system protein ParE